MVAIAQAGPVWNEQTYIVPIVDGRTVAVGTLNAASVEVVGINPQRNSITFHNPNISSNINVFVCQAQDANGSNLPAAPDGAGCFCIFPGASLTFEGNVGGAWNACSASGSNQALTVLCGPQ